MGQDDISLPKNFREEIQKEFQQSKENHISFEEYYNSRRAAYIADRRFKAELKKLNIQRGAKSTTCANSTFDNYTDLLNNGLFHIQKIDDWYFKHATVSGGGVLLDNVTEQFQVVNGKKIKVVGQGVDPNVGINQVRLAGGNHALKLSRSIGDYPPAGPVLEAEIAIKHITINNTNRLINFWFACVFFSPDGWTYHQDKDKPSFWVRVKDSQGNTSYGLVDLGNGSDKIVADPANNELAKKYKSNGQVEYTYKDWTCGTIDLGHFADGDEVTIEFIVRHCGKQGHWAYSYLDDFCAGLCYDFADVEIDLTNNSDCGIPGSICVDYDLPEVDFANGNERVKLDLNIYQNGNLVKTLQSPYFQSDNNPHCFYFHNNDMQAVLGSGLGAFDYEIVANYYLYNNGNYVFLFQRDIGSPGTGIKTGLNNDYTIDCPCLDMKSVHKSIFQYNPDQIHYLESLALDEGGKEFNEIRISVVDLKINGSESECKKCSHPPLHWGGFLAWEIMHPDQNLVWHSTAFPHLTLPQGLTAFGFDENPREAIWTSNTSNPFTIPSNSSLGLGFVLPTSSTISCCNTIVDICLKITTVDKDCNYCEIYKCGQIEYKGTTVLSGSIF